MRANSETVETDGSSKSSDYYYVLRSIQEELVDQQENSQNLSNQEESSSQTRSFERSESSKDKSSSDFADLLPERLSSRTQKQATKKAKSSREKSTERSTRRPSKRTTERAPETAIESSQSTDVDLARLFDQTSETSSFEEPQLDNSQLESSQLDSSQPANFQRTKKRILTHLEQIQEEYASIAKCIHPAPTCDRFNPFDRVRLTYLLKEALNSHRLDEITRLYTLNAKEKSICPYLLSKTGFLLFRKFIELRPEMEEELANDLLDFVKHIRFPTGNESLVMSHYK